LGVRGEHHLVSGAAITSGACQSCSDLASGIDGDRVQRQGGDLGRRLAEQRHQTAGQAGGGIKVLVVQAAVHQLPPGSSHDATAQHDP
jgi:hypothetical protein